MPKSTTITGCQFYGVHWDEKATAAVHALAEAMKAEAQAADRRAQATLALADVFKASNVHIDAMLRVNEVPNA